jgi:hypothetical protein
LNGYGIKGPRKVAYRRKKTAKTAIGNPMAIYVAKITIKMAIEPRTNSIEDSGLTKGNLVKM